MAFGLPPLLFSNKTRLLGMEAEFVDTDILKEEEGRARQIPTDCK